MEDILLGLVFIVCIYILYCIFTPVKEGFQVDEDRLGDLATLIKVPTNWDNVGNNPTGIIASAAKPISRASATGKQNMYDVALGTDSGPRIDDNTSLLYMVDFCYQGAKATNPFSDTNFATNCGICMTQGTLINGTSGSNLGVVVYPADKAYSRSQGIDAVPSSHAATCAPILKKATTGATVRSIAIDATQYNDTKSYMQGNMYTMSSGLQSATNKGITCSGSSNGHDYVIKAGFYRDGEWDSHLPGAPIDYSRRNLLTTTAIPSSCIEQKSCTITTSSLQWDMASLCGYPKPTPLTSLGVDTSKTTANSLTFIWTGGEYADNAQYSLVKQSDSSTVAGTNATLNLVGKSIKYTGLTRNTTYIFRLAVSNPSGTAQGSYTTTSGFTNFVERFFDTVTGQVEAKTADDRDLIAGLTITNQTQTAFSASWTGGTNATAIRATLSDPSTNTQVQDLSISPGATVCPFTNLTAGKDYTVTLIADYTDSPSVSISVTGQTLGAIRVAMSGVTFSAATTTGFTVTWSGCDGATGITLSLDGAGVGNQAIKQVAGTTRSITYDGLQAGTSYTFKGTCTYSSGSPLTSSSYTKSTENAPATPKTPMSGVSSSVVTTTGFTITWSGCDGATGITLSLDRAGVGNQDSKEVVATTRSYTYSGLPAGTTYTFTGTCTYPDGSSLTSSPFTLITSNAPAAPATPGECATGYYKIQGYVPGNVPPHNPSAGATNAVGAPDYAHSQFIQTLEGQGTPYYNVMSTPRYGCIKVGFDLPGYSLPNPAPPSGSGAPTGAGVISYRWVGNQIVIEWSASMIQSLYTNNGCTINNFKLSYPKALTGPYDDPRGVPYVGGSLERTFDSNTYQATLPIGNEYIKYYQGVRLGLTTTLDPSTGQHIGTGPDGLNIFGIKFSINTSCYSYTIFPTIYMTQDQNEAARIAAGLPPTAEQLSIGSTAEVQLNPDLFIDTLIPNSKGLGSFTLRWRNSTVNISKAELAPQSAQYTITQPQIRITRDSWGVDVTDYYCVITAGSDGFISKANLGLGHLTSCIDIYLYSGSSIICIECVLPKFGLKCAQYSGYTRLYDGGECYGNIIGPSDDTDGNIKPTPILVTTIKADRLDTALVGWPCQGIYLGTSYKL